MIDRVLVDEAMHANPAFGRIVRRELTDMLTRFAEKSLDYKDGAQDLGIMGQFADINRKFIKLRRALWDGHVLVGEPVDEVLKDLIAHCFLTLDMLRSQPVQMEVRGVASQSADLLRSPNRDPGEDYWSAECLAASCLVEESHTNGDHRR